MEKPGLRLGAQKSGGCLIVLFVPSRDRNEESIEQEVWVTASLKILGTYFGGIVIAREYYEISIQEASHGT